MIIDILRLPGFNRPQGFNRERTKGTERIEAADWTQTHAMNMNTAGLRLNPAEEQFVDGWANTSSTPEPRSL